MMSPGDKFAKMRVAAGYSRAKLAKAIGLSKDSVARWETYGSIPKDSTKEKLCVALGCKMEDLPFPSDIEKKREHRRSDAYRYELDQTAIAYIKTMPVQTKPNNCRDWLIKARIERGLSAKRVAIMSNISERYYVLVERGEATPPIPTARRIAKVLSHKDVTEERLLGGE